MPPRWDPTSVYDVKYKSGSKRIRKHEPREDFVVRVRKAFPQVIKDLHGNFEAACSVFSVEERILKAIIATDKRCRDAWTKERAKAVAAEYDSVPAPAGVDIEASEVEKRLIRKNWPVDPDERESAMKDALMVSLIENEGDVQEVSQCLNLPMHEILEALEADEELQIQKERGMKIAVLRSEAALAHAARNGNVQAIKAILVNKAPDEWTDRQNVTVKHEGFSPPASEDSGASVLSIVKGNKE